MMPHKVPTSSGTKKNPPNFFFRAQVFLPSFRFCAQQFLPLFFSGRKMGCRFSFCFCSWERGEHPKEKSFSRVRVECARAPCKLVKSDRLTPFLPNSTAVAFAGWRGARAMENYFLETHVKQRAPFYYRHRKLVQALYPQIGRLHYDNNSCYLVRFVSFCLATLQM